MNLRLFILIMAIAGLTSCTVYRNIPIEILQTEEVNLGKVNPKIALIYRNFKYTSDTLRNYYLQSEVLVKERDAFMIRNTDSIVVHSCLKSLADKLAENTVSSGPVIFPLDIFPRQTGERLHPLPEELVKKLSLPAQADYLIFLETFTYFFAHHPTPPAGSEFQEVRMAGIWSLHDVATGKVVDIKNMTDTLYWEQKNDPNSYHNVNKLPPRMVALQQAAEHFGEQYAKRFYADWETVDRLLIIPPLEDFRLAAEFAEKQQWEQAEKLWLKYADQRFRRLSVSASYNLSLSREISDDIEGAIKWANKAVELARIFNDREEIKLTAQYAGILKTRLSEIRASEKGNNK